MTGVAQPNATTDTNGEAWRHACEVRFVLNMPGSDARRMYLDGVEQRRGKLAADRLRADVRQAWEQAKGRAA